MNGERLGERLRIGDGAEGAVQDVVAAVADEQRAASTAQRERAGEAESGGGLLDAPDRRRGAERGQFDRQRKAPELRHALACVGDDHQAARRRSDDLLAQQRAAAALDQPQRAVDFVGAVDGQIELGRLVERRQRNSKLARLARRRFRGRHADDSEPLANLGADQIDEMAGGRACAEAKPHARPNEGDRLFSGLMFVGLAVRQIPHSAAGVSRPRRWPSDSTKERQIVGGGASGQRRRGRRRKS